MSNVIMQEDAPKLNNINVKIEEKSSQKEFSAEQKKELLYIKSLEVISEKCHAYAGLFAGFEGFIINSYVRSADLTSVSPPIEIGYLFIFLSLFGNILVTAITLMLSGLIKSGVALGQYWWMRILLRICVTTCMISTVLYALAFQLYVADSVVRWSIKISIWVISSILVASVVAFFFFCFKKTLEIPEDESERVIEFIEN